MKLIADSGATKTDWYCGNNMEECRRIQTSGLNPLHRSEEETSKLLHTELLPQLTEGMQTAISEIHFYGAGCLPEPSERMQKLLARCFPHADIYVRSDLEGAAIALCQGHAGIACILGTGANSCCYDGQRITAHIPPLGYLLGDEGSGTYLGKCFVADCLKGLLPGELRQELLDYLRLTPDEIITRVYRMPGAGAFLASICPFIAAHRTIPQVHAFLIDCFSTFFRRNVLPYAVQLPVSFVGSVAWNFKEEICQAAQSSHLATGTFLQTPIEALAAYHFTTGFSPEPNRNQP